MRHPGGACGYRFEKNGASIVTLFDNEYHDNQKQDLIEFCQGADLVVWDGMFTEEELFQSKVGDTLQLKELTSLQVYHR